MFLKNVTFSGSVRVPRHGVIGGAERMRTVHRDTNRQQSHNRMESVFGTEKVTAIPIEWNQSARGWVSENVPNRGIVSGEDMERANGTKMHF